MCILYNFLYFHYTTPRPVPQDVSRRKLERSTNGDLFPEGSKVRKKVGKCRRCSNNSWTVTREWVTDSRNTGGYKLKPTCDQCGYVSGSYGTKYRDMSDDYELI